MLAVAAIVVDAAAAPGYRSIQRGQWIHRKGSDVFCEAYVPGTGHASRRFAFDCSVFRKTYPIAHTYRVLIGDWGIDVELWTSAGGSTLVRSFLNPRQPAQQRGLGSGTGAAHGLQFDLGTGQAVRLGTSSLFCGAVAGKSNLAVLSCAVYARVANGWRCCAGGTYGLYLTSSAVVVRRNTADGRDDRFVAEFDD
jgi:hypothetical protein